ncbi:MAG: tRNA (N6-isopentenyl adenosine(37)-C2)-methylthiotransferase MiaB [Dethiobacteria bacterium]|nr:tRNA (N6-isopentenyl adenosine(37)-C2)-methylthiotransferase MiaB [Dethiobacteria bacterium]
MNRDYLEMLEQTGRFGVGKKSHIVTLGCQMNEHDSEVIAAILENIGYSSTTEAAEADLIIINTFAVRKKHEDKVASLLGKYALLKVENKDLIIAVGGCMTQQGEIARYIKERFQHVNLVFGTHALPRLPQLLAETMHNKNTLVDIKDDQTGREGLPVSHKSTYHAWLPVIYGCNNYCSYCVVPYVRGRERSRDMQDILAEARSLAAEGYLEVTLLGQNVNSYGHDLKSKYNFSDLLAELDLIEGLQRIRFMTSHPKDLSPQLIETVRQGEKLCEHFHLPVQSGSNRILDLMNRGYHNDQYLELIYNVNQAIPGVSITSDFIIGFPGEEEEDFLESVKLIEKARFDNAFSFIYSPRSKTAAANMPDNVTPAEKEERLQRLNSIQHQISREKNHLLINTSVELLVEGVSKTNPSMLTGRTRTNKLVHFSGTDDLVSSLVKVNITDARTWNLVGELKGGSC